MPGPVTTRHTALVELERRRNQEMVLAEAALVGERRVALVRLAMICLFAAAYELIPWALGTPNEPDLWRIVAGNVYVLFSLGTIVALRRVKPDPRKSLIIPFITMTIDFGFISFMALRQLETTGAVYPEMGVAAFAILICFSITRNGVIHVVYATGLACASYLGIAVAHGDLRVRTTPFVFGGFIALGFLVAMTNVSVRRMFADLRRRDNLTRFLPAPVAERVLAHGQDALSPVMRDVTVLFSDIRGFTALSEALPPRDVLTFLDDYFGRMTQIVKGRDGVVGKFLGDGLLAFWGVPDRDPSHAEHALRAALDMRRALADFNEERAREGLPAIRIGIGVHTGPVAAGMLGGAEQHEYTVIGDAVNLASRIEGLTKTHDVDLLVSETTWRLAEGHFTGARVAEEAIRGRKDPVVVYTLPPA